MPCKQENQTNAAVCTARVGGREVGYAATSILFLKGKSAARKLKRGLLWLDNMVWISKCYALVTVIAHEVMSDNV